jgi:peroxiredoxin
LKKLGGEIVVFSSETNTISKSMADKQKLGFPIVQDTGLAIARSLGLAFMLPDDLKAAYQSFGIDLPKNTGYASWELPMPARIVVAKGGVVRSVEADPDYTVRPEAEDTLAIVKAL